ncbi:hypothetical protein [Rubrobacter aplysinae]|uniref:hypothetical protein n=1 Tax=Rubrobacter aplysinae TaxID=909625 RepID=UPI00064C2806|nr:hypothetical protein [Rubrobacter aplysinae]
MQIFVDLASVARDVVTAVALIIGGGFAYFKFIRGRTFRPRLNLVLTSKVRREQGVLHVLMDCGARNIGARELRITAEGTAVRLLASSMVSTQQDVEQSSQSSQSSQSGWDLIGVWQPVEAKTLEPEEPLEESVLVTIPDGGQVALRIEFSVSIPSGESWQASDIVFLAGEDDNEY